MKKEMSDWELECALAELEGTDPRNCLISSRGLHFENLLKNKQWETKDKKVLNISEMTSEHIKSCMSMIERSGMVWRDKWYPLLMNELINRDSGQGEQI